MASGNTIFALDRDNMKPPATLYAIGGQIQDTSTPNAVLTVLKFDTTTQWWAHWFETMPSHYGGGGFTISAKGGTDNTSTGDFDLDVRMIVIADATILTGDLGLDSATAVSLTDTPPSTPINKMNQWASGTLTHSNAGSPAVGVLVGISATRVVATDNNSGFLQLNEILILET